MPGFFCHNSKTIQYLATNALCSNYPDEACGRFSRCYYSKVDDTNAECKQYFSINDDDDIYVRSEYDVFLCSSLAAESEDQRDPDDDKDNPLSNFRTNILMKCGLKYKSANKGLNCYEYNCDVRHMDNTQKLYRAAQCDCFMDTTGIPVCGPMNGDIEFDEYRAAFKSYMEQSRYCHAMRDLEYECGDRHAFYNL